MASKHSVEKHIMGKVKLHGLDLSPFSARVIWALKLKGIEYDFIEEDPHNKSPELLEYNPVYKKIPFLIHSGKPVCESMIIVEYIDEVWPNKPLLPADPFERALVHFWVKFVEDKGTAVWKLFRSFGEDQEKAIEESLEMFKIIEEQCIGEKKLFGEDDINILDIALGAIIHWLQVLEDIIDVKILEAEKFPRLHSWINNFRDISQIKDNLPNREKMLAFFKTFREKLSVSS